MFINCIPILSCFLCSCKPKMYDENTRRPYHTTAFLRRCRICNKWINLKLDMNNILFMSHLYIIIAAFYFDRINKRLHTFSCENISYYWFVLTFSEAQCSNKCFQKSKLYQPLSSSKSSNASRSFSFSSSSSSEYSTNVSSICSSLGPVHQQYKIIIEIHCEHFIFISYKTIYSLYSEACLQTWRLNRRFLKIRFATNCNIRSNRKVHTWLTAFQ